MGPNLVRPVVRLDALSAVIPISGAHYVHIDTPIDLQSLQHVSFMGPATTDEAQVIDEQLKIILPDWGFTDPHWCDHLLIAVSELMVNIAQYAESLPQAREKELHVLMHTFSGKTYRYLWVWVDGKGLPPCDPAKLHTDLPDDPDAEHGRGTHIVQEFTDAFLVIKRANSFIVMKRAPVS